MNTQLAAGVSIKDFKSSFRQFFVNPAGLGLVESQFNRFAHDLFQDYDREVQNQYAKVLGLTHALYSGTQIKTTRPFCDKRWGNIYTKEEIKGWNSQKWQGKRKGVPVEVQCGGYNCRHHLSWLTEEVAKRIGNINKYN
jgi:hypothetical protein